LAGPTAVTLIIESPVDYHDSFAAGVEHDDENEELFSCALFPIIVINLSVNCVSKGTNNQNVYLWKLPTPFCIGRRPVLVSSATFLSAKHFGSFLF
jgi:hypothetical protein